MENISKYTLINAIPLICPASCTGRLEESGVYHSCQFQPKFSRLLGGGQTGVLGGEQTWVLG